MVNIEGKNHNLIYKKKRTYIKKTENHVCIHKFMVSSFYPAGSTFLIQFFSPEGAETPQVMQIITQKWRHL